MSSRSVTTDSFALMPPALSRSASRSRRPVSIEAPRAADTWTAGSSPKRLGSANTMPMKSATAMSAYFHAGYWLIILISGAVTSGRLERPLEFNPT